MIKTDRIQRALSILFALSVCFSPLVLRAQDSTLAGRTSPSSVEIDITTQKKLVSVQELLKNEQWDEAFPVLNQLIQSQVTLVDQQTNLVRVNDQLFVNLRTYCHILISQCPQEGLKKYRELVDPLIEPLYRQAESKQDASLYRKVLELGYSSSFGDGALFASGESAWSEGKISLARSYWTQLIPLNTDSNPENVRPVLRYPDADQDRPEILARLFLCSLVEGDLTRAEQELRAFSHLYPKARGVLAGRTGNLAGMLESRMEESRKWVIENKNQDVTTFAQNSRRTGSVTQSLDIGEKKYSFETPELISSSRNSFAPEYPFYPVVYNGNVFINNELEIRGWNLETGNPAWTDSREDSPVIYSSRLLRNEVEPNHSVSGSFHYTMTIDQGLLFARMGTSVLNKSSRELRELKSELVCLDLKNAQGKLEWLISSEELGKQAVIEGSPIIKGNRGYVTIRKMEPDFEVELLCFERNTGKPLWKKTISSMMKPLAGWASSYGHQLLSADENSIYYLVPDFGLISIEQLSGTMNWIYYFRKNRLSSGDMNSEELLPPVIQDNQVFIVSQSDQMVISLDTESGTEVWKKSLDEEIEHVLGIHQRRLVISGKKLMALNIHNGSLEWQVGYVNPAGHSRGRGTIAGDLVYWPTVEELILVDILSGKIRHRNHLMKLHGLRGGNITLANRKILIAEDKKLSVFSPFGNLRKKNEDDQTYSIFFPDGKLYQLRAAREEGQTGSTTRLHSGRLSRNSFP